MFFFSHSQLLGVATDKSYVISHPSVQNETGIGLFFEEEGKRNKQQQQKKKWVHFRVKVVYDQRCACIW